MKRVGLWVAAGLLIVAGWVATEAVEDANGAAGTFGVPVVNFNDSGEQVVKLDIDGNAVDAHDGDLAYFEGAYYLYGTSYDCGYALNTVGTPFCGFKVYRSADLQDWEDYGSLFDASTPVWQDRCAPPSYGCYRPHVIRNASTGKYVLWVNGYWNSSATASGYMVLTSDSPTGPFTEVGEPTLAQQGASSWGGSGGDHDLFVDSNGTAYVAYTRVSGHTLWIERLNASYTSGTGQHVSVGVSGKEAPSLFKHGSAYHLIYSSTCPYCNSGDAFARTASSPIGSWGPEVALSPDSCGGQTSFVAEVNGAKLLGIDLWKQGATNQGLANYGWVKLTFDSGDAPEPFICPKAQWMTLVGSNTNPPAPTSDQSSGEYGFRSHCDIKSSIRRSQSFVPSKSGVLNGLSVSLYKSSSVNADVMIDVVQMDMNAKQIGEPLVTRGISRSAITYSARMHRVIPNVNVTAGTRYGFVVRTTSTGCFGFLYSDSQPYAFGSEAYNGTMEANRSLKFSTEVQ